MSKYFNNVEWSEENKNNLGLPRPYSNIPKEIQNKNKKYKFYLHPKVPIPWQSIPKFMEMGLLSLNKVNEKKSINDELCPYCGIKIDSEETCIIWISYQDMVFEKRSIVQTDAMPFHLECMKQGRIFCPFMRTQKKGDFKIGKFKDLIIESRKNIKEIPPP